MKKPSVLIVDDMEINLLVLEKILKDDYDVTSVESGLAAVEKLFGAEIAPAVILLDIRMPQMDGYQVLAILKSNENFNKIPVIFITAENSESQGLAAGAVDFISKPFQADVVKLRVANQIKLKQYTDSLEELLKKKTEELSLTQGRIIEAMASIIEYRNLESGSHIKRTGNMTLLLINHMIAHSEYSRELLNLNPPLVVKSVPLHDVGKIGVPDHILLKPGRLTGEEFEVIKTHTTIGKEIVESILKNEDSLYLRHCKDICHYHHERFDGKGYPAGLNGTDIPLSARIVSVVDVYDALTSKRVYKGAYSHEEAMRIIMEASGSQFDPVVTRCVMEIDGAFRAVGSFMDSV